jgi:hypothetical protein
MAGNPVAAEGGFRVDTPPAPPAAARVVLVVAVLFKAGFGRAAAVMDLLPGLLVGVNRAATSPAFSAVLKVVSSGRRTEGLGNDGPEGWTSASFPT